MALLCLFKSLGSAYALRAHIKNHLRKGEIDVDALLTSQRTSVENKETEQVCNKEEDEDDLLIEVNEPMELEVTPRNKDSKSTDISKQLKALNVLPKIELQMLEEMTESSTERIHSCTFCSTNSKFSQKPHFLRHLIFLHSKNKDLFKAWVKEKTKISLSIAGKTKPICCACKHRTRSMNGLRNHLDEHIIKAEEAADFLTAKGSLIKIRFSTTKPPTLNLRNSRQN